ADFRTCAIKAADGTLRMMAGRLFDVRSDAEPITNGSDFTEGNSCLRHAEWARIHPQKNYALRASAESAQVFLMRAPGVLQRPVNANHRRTEVQVINLRRQLARCLNQFFRSIAPGHVFEFANSTTISRALLGPRLCAPAPCV